MWLLGCIACNGCSLFHYAPPPTATEIIFTETNDHWRLALHHFAAHSPSVQRNYPVVICHGIMSNRHNWNLDKTISLPLYLTQQGFDVWLVELRGAGLSHFIGNDNDGFSLDDLVMRDLPAIIAKVMSQTNTSQIHWVGHSMGGMIMYAYLARANQNTIRSFTAVGSPSFFYEHNAHLTRLQRWAPVYRSLFTTIPSGFFSRLTAPFASPDLISPLYVLWNADDITPELARRGAHFAVENAPSRLVTQLIGTHHAGHLMSEDATWDYTENLTRIETPTFFIAGAQDQLAPPAVLMYAYRTVASVDKRIAVLSQANGYSHDYGHLDLAIGQHAPLEVYPLIATWLMSHD